MITDAQNKANLGSAARLAATDLGLSLADTSSWDYATRAEYLDHLAGVILAYPDQFNDLTTQMASSIYQQNFPALDPTTGIAIIDGGAAFGPAIENQLTAAGDDVAALGSGVLALIHGVGDAVGAAGQGIRNVGNVSTWLLPVAAIALVIMITQSAAKRTTQSAWLK